MTPQALCDHSQLDFSAEPEVDSDHSMAYFSEPSDLEADVAVPPRENHSDDDSEEASCEATVGGARIDIDLGAPLFVEQLFEGSLCCPGTLHLVNNAAKDMGARMRWFTEWCDRANDLALFFRHRHTTSVYPNMPSTYKLQTHGCVGASTTFRQMPTPPRFPWGSAPKPLPSPKAPQASD